MAARSRIGLIFHGIGTPGRALEPGEAPYWVSLAQFEDILDRIAAAPDPQVFQVTFDDGNVSDHDIALPRLRDRGLTADFFVLSGRIDQPGSLSQAQILSLQAADQRIGSHGIGHRNLRQLDDAALAQELSQSRAALERVCRRPITALGIPFGLYDARVLRAARRAGYAVAYSSDRGPMCPTAFLRPRTSFRGDMTPDQIAAVLSARLSPMASLRRTLGMARRRWL
jgi:peptidoglycan/xylan/chitin deacetylase (PgdA/CDA1 family)